MKTALGLMQCSGPDVLFSSFSGEGKWGGEGVGEEEMARKQWSGNSGALGVMIAVGVLPAFSDQ